MAEDLLSVRGRREVSNWHDFDTAELELEHRPLLYSLEANVKLDFGRKLGLSPLSCDAWPPPEPQQNGGCIRY